MTDIKAIQGQVQERLSELEAQIEQLSSEFEQLQTIARMLARTNGGSSTAAPKARRRPAVKATRAPAAAPTGTRAQRGGNRAQQALDLIAAQPGLTAAELADAMKMKRNYLYRVLPALEKDGRISKRGQGYHPAGTPAAS